MIDIIGIAGRARSGKSTIADYLYQRHGYYQRAFADPMRDMLAAGFGWGPNELSGDLKEVIDERFGFSPRKALQLIGTEFGRGLNPDIWVLLAKKWLDELWMDRAVFTDVRFENEAAFVRSQGGTVWHIVRDCAGATNGIVGHVSENGIDFVKGDVLIENDGTLDELYTKINFELASKDLRNAE